MPIHVLPSAISRRRFVSNLLAAAAGTAVGLAGKQEALLQAQDLKDESREFWALLSDTHIAADAQLNARGINMAAHLSQAVEEVLQAHSKRPFAGLMVNGDCAFLDGQAEDYRTFASLIEPLSAKGIPIHLTLGNHDERNRIQSGLASVFAPAKPEGAKTGVNQRPKLVDKIASKVRGRFCDWYLLDSLDMTNVTPGRIGAEQLAWLEQSLAAAPNRPALVMVHHNPHPSGLGKVSGITDTDAFLSLLLERKQVKALFFGHTHVAKTFELQGLHLVNLPACAYRFNPEQPTGWTSALIGPEGCSLTLADTSKAHPLHAQELHLSWRPL